MKVLGKCLELGSSFWWKKKIFFFHIGPGWHELDEACVSGKQESSPDTLKPGQHQGLVDAPVGLVSESEQLPRDVEHDGGSQEPG